MRRGEGNTFRTGLIAVVLIAVFAFWGFTAINPFKSTFTLYATFRTADDIKPNSPVRVAGVNVGVVNEVKAIKGSPGLARVKMGLHKGLPIHTDAVAKIRPRIFLEGNFFVDVQPGTSAAPIAKSGYQIPVQQTAVPVQFGQVLTALQADTRTDLQRFLREYSVNALGNGGAQAYNRSLDSAPGAFKNASIANEAALGEQPHDLSQGVLRGQQRLSKALDADPAALKGLVTNLDTTTLAFAREDLALQRTVPALNDVLTVGRPALDSLNAALPHVRAFAVDALPAVRSSGPTIDASMPFISQARRLVSKPELRGLVSDLVPTVPALARLNRATVPLLNENRALSACTSKVLVPFATTPVPDPDFPANSGKPFTQEGGSSFVGLAGESRLNDPNTPYYHIQVDSGPTSIEFRDPNGDNFIAQTASPPKGVRPLMPDHRPLDRPGVPCETQDPPDMSAPGGAGDTSVTPGGGCSPTTNPLGCVPALRRRRVMDQWGALKSYRQRQARGLPGVDPLPYTDQAFRAVLQRAGLKLDSRGAEVAEHPKPRGPGR